MRVVVHAGYHKTGTTSIQVTLTRSRERLRAAGILYPQTGVPPQFPYGHHLLPWSLTRVNPVLPISFDPQSAHDLWAELIAEIERSACPLVVLSSEEFDRLDAAAIRAAGAALSGYDVVPVVFVRNHAELIESMFRTHVVALGYTAPIARFAAEEAPRLDCADMVRDWGAVAAAGTALVIPYDDEAVRRDSVAAFLAAAGIDEGVLEPGARGRANPSLPAFVCETVRYLRGAGADEAELQRWLAWIGGLEFGSAANARFVCMPPALRDALNDRYAAEARKLGLPAAGMSPDGVAIADPLGALTALVRALPAARPIN
jgi:hypothetical protein